MSSPEASRSLPASPSVLVRLPLPGEGRSTEVALLLSRLRDRGVVSAVLREPPIAKRVWPTSLGARLWSDFALSRAALELEETAWREQRPLSLILVDGWEASSLVGAESMAGVADDVGRLESQSPGFGPLDFDRWVEALVQRSQIEVPGAILGAVLVGGHSRRMGRDKGQLPVHPGEPEGGTWADRGWFLARRVCSRAVFVTRRGQDLATPVVSRCAPSADQLFDRREEAGPLAALETALVHAEACGEEAVLSLPADLPYLSLEALETLRKGWMTRGDGDAGVAFAAGGDRQGEGSLDPAVLLLGVSTLSQVRKLLDAGVRRLGAIFDEVRFAGVPRPESVPEVETLSASSSRQTISPLENCNRPEDWVRYAALFPSGDDTVRQER